MLENYLDRSISFTELLHDDLDQPRNNRGVDPRDNMRLILCIQGQVRRPGTHGLGTGEELAGFLRDGEALRRGPPQGRSGNRPPGGGVRDRDARRGIHRGPGARVRRIRSARRAAKFPVSRHALRQWAIREPLGRQRLGSRHEPARNANVVLLPGESYIDVGIEAIHFGQVALMDQNDPGHVHWIDMLGRVRAYARKHARRHFLLCDAHTPTGGYVEDGKLLFDFHSFPLRIVEVADHPYQGVLKVGYSDAIFLRSQGGVTPSGWSCEHLPYLVEFDNFGRSNPGKPSKPPFIWGWDEITWFALLPEAERNQWLRYAWKWVKETDPNGHLQMPGSRVMTPGKPDAPRWYWANTRSDACPQGFNTEATIKELWGMR